MFCCVLTIFLSLPLRFTLEKLSKSIQMVSLHPVTIIDAIIVVQGITGFYVLIFCHFPFFSLWYSIRNRNIFSAFLFLTPTPEDFIIEC